MRRSTAAATALPTAHSATTTSAAALPAAAEAAAVLLTTTSQTPPPFSSKKSRKRELSSTSSSLYYYTAIPVCLCILIVILDFVYLEVHHTDTNNDNNSNNKGSVVGPAATVKSALLSLPTLQQQQQQSPLKQPQQDELHTSSLDVLEKNGDDLVSSPNTIVTAYFQIRSKYPKETYMEWMSVMLSVQDAMVVFTTEDWVDPIMSLRQHAKNRTHIVVMPLDAVPMAKDYSQTYWEGQLSIDREKKRHAGYQVFWIWLSKTYFVTEAIRLNPYKSEFFMWSDIGCFRGHAAERYRGKILIQHPEVVPKDRILFLSHNEVISPPESLWWNNKLREKNHFYHSGSQMAGYVDVWATYHAAFMETFKGFNDRRLFVGDDQPVFQCACLQHPSLCAYVPRDQVKDNHYFGLRYVVHHGGKFTYWLPPNITAPEVAAS